jgi:putative protease
MMPQGSHRFVLEQMQDQKGNPIEIAPGSGYRIRIPAPVAGDATFGLLLVESA